MYALVNTHLKLEDCEDKHGFTQGLVDAFSKQSIYAVSSTKESTGENRCLRPYQTDTYLLYF